MDYSGGEDVLGGNQGGKVNTNKLTIGLYIKQSNLRFVIQLRPDLEHIIN